MYCKQEELLKLASGLIHRDKLCFLLLIIDKGGVFDH